MVKMKSRRLIVFLSVIICTISCCADVTFRFAGGTIDAGVLKAKMENNISELLTEINRAGSQGTALNLSSINMEPGAKERLAGLWNNVHFVCDRQTNIYRCLNDYQGYQVREIPITMKPMDSTYTQSINRQLTISLNKNGVITGVRPAMELKEDVNKFFEDATGVEDVIMRNEILKWVEDFRCYYNEKNLKALNQIYSDDALIITGSVVMPRKSSGDIGLRLGQKVKYNVQTKAQYISKLSVIFKNNIRINVLFDDIAVVKHPAKLNIYGVTLHQKWQTSSYSDEGWLFLLWDFNEPERPQIHVRTWQPGQVISKDGVFTLDDFKLP